MISIDFQQAIPWVLSANTLALMWLVGNRRIAGWALGVIGQALWFAFIFTWQVWGLLPLATSLTVVYSRNLILWRRERHHLGTTAHHTRPKERP